MELTISEFQKVANLALRRIFDALEEIEEIDIENSGEVITINQGDLTYIINRHSPSQQIWISSPISGGVRFSYDKNNNLWRGPNKEELLKFITEEVKIVFNISSIK